MVARRLYLEIVVVPHCWSNPLRGLDVFVCLSGEKKTSVCRRRKADLFTQTF